MLTVILMLILFVFLIFPHELGHFIAAKACGVKVNEFAFGMGPAIFKRQGKETLYSIRAIPVGGYCAMEGDDTEESGDDPRAFNNKKWWQKIIILIAGAAMNVFIAFLALTILAAAGGVITNTLEAVTEGSPAELAGIRAGDTVVMVGEEETNSWYDVVNALDAQLEEGKPVAITVKRDGNREVYSMVPTVDENGKYRVGIVAKLSHSPGIAIKSGAESTVSLFKALVGAFMELFKSKDMLEQVSGPIGMAQVVSETTSYGGMYFLYLLAVISLNLAIFNLLPFPALDGGRIIFVFIRLITGKAISDSIESKVHAVGMIILILFAMVVAGSDVLKLINR